MRVYLWYIIVVASMTVSDAGYICDAIQGEGLSVIEVMIEFYDEGIKT